MHVRVHKMGVVAENRTRKCHAQVKEVADTSDDQAFSNTRIALIKQAKLIWKQERDTVWVSVLTTDFLLNCSTGRCYCFYNFLQQTLDNCFQIATWTKLGYKVVKFDADRC